MAQRNTADAPKNARPGDLLLAVHEFQARSPDEISLVKGDRVELIEKDDDFGDGWYLGKHLQSANTGLFPEVYTIIAPKTAQQPGPRQADQKLQQPPTPTQPTISVTNQGSRDDSPSKTAAQAAAAATSGYSQPTTYNGQPGGLRQISPSRKTPQQGSSVMSEMHNVINEHMSDLNKPRHLEPIQDNQDIRPSSGGSASQYSRDYIAGEETDEEEEAAAGDSLTDEKVRRWSPDTVSSYLLSVGVEKAHCDLFREEEFTGEVLLEMDQAQVFMKELDLGPIGRRMRTWQKIKAMQDEVKFGTLPPENRMSNRAAPVNTAVGSRRQTSGGFSSENRRPSAASVRELGHSRRHSSTEQAYIGDQSSKSRGTGALHSKQTSFDRGWTMGGPSSSISGSPRPMSTTNLPGLGPHHTPYGSTTASSQISLGIATDRADVDRGYTSGGEADSKRPRRLLRKRDTSSDQHKRVSSYGSDSRRSSKGFFWQKSRESREEPKPSVESGSRSSQKDGVRIVSEPAHGDGSPTVTRLEYDDDVSKSNRQSAPNGNKASSAVEQRASTMSETGERSGSRRGMRAISDAVTGRERIFASRPAEKVLPGESTIVQSPSEASASPGSSTTFADANKSEFSTPQHALSASGTKRKPKQQTSAYIRGLQKLGPQEQKAGSDYSGWMKKKSSNLMTTWKPRYFVLKGRRLSYYYSEDDTEEKGLIDISSHRVLPANNDFFTGLHATLTGANNGSPMSGPNTPATPSSASTVASRPYGSLNPSSPSMNGNTSEGQPFIFKLVPPRSGLSKGVNFTKPSVHYFAVPTKAEGRLWMAGLMKSTIDRDDERKVVTTYQQKTISLEQARARRELPPFLKGVEEEQAESGAQEEETAQPIEPPAEEGNITNQSVDTASTVSKPPSSSAGASTGAGGTSASSVPGSYNAPGLQKVQREGPADLPQIMTSMERNGVVASSTSDTKRTSRDTRSSTDQKGLGIQGLSSGVSNEPGSPIIDKMKSVGMW